MASAIYDYRSAGVRDVSRRLVDLEKRPCTRVRFTKRFSFASADAENDYERQRSTFFSAHECRDDYMETREGVDFDGTDEFRDRVVVFSDPSRLTSCILQFNVHRLNGLLGSFMLLLITITTIAILTTNDSNCQLIGPPVNTVFDRCN